MTSMLPTITDSARNYLIKTADKQNATNVYFGVQGGGCAGFKYKWDSIETDKINPEDEVTLSQLERSNLLKELNTKQSKYIIGLINEMNKLGNVSEIKHKEIFKILNQYGLNESIIEAISPSIYNKNHSEIKLIEEAVSDINSDQGDPNFYKFINE